MSITNQLNKTFFNASGGVLARGTIIRATAGANQASTAFASTGAGVVNVAGVMGSLSAGLGSAFLAQISGVTEVLMETGLTPVAGQQVFVSAAVAGRGTNVPPVNAVYVGYITDVSKYASRSLVSVVLQLAESSGSSDVASWTGTRYYAVDNVNGSDSNAGYSDVSLAAAGTVAVKTPEQLARIIPSMGVPSQTLVIAFKGRTGIYVGPDGITIANFYKTFVGYSNVVIRSTNDFSDDATDIRVLAPETVLGPYTVDAGSTTSTIPVVGGGLPTDKTPFGYRIRFTSGALLDTFAHWDNNDATTITVGQNMASAPIAGVTFVVEKPAVELGTMLVAAYCGTAAPGDMGIAGFECQTRLSLVGASLIGRIAFCNVIGTATTVLRGCETLTVTNTYLGSSGSTVNVGVGLRHLSTGTFTITDVGIIGGLSRTSIQVGTGSIGITAGGVVSSTVLAALYLNKTSGSTTLQITGFGGGPNFAQGPNILGNGSSSTTRPMRIGGGTTVQCRGSFGFYGLVLEDGASLRWTGTAVGVSLDNVTGTTTSAYPVNCEELDGSTILCGINAANTAAGSAGAGLAAAGSNPLLWTGFALTNVVDVAGNNYIGTAGKIVSAAVAVTNNSGTAYAVGDVLRGNGTTNQTTSAQADTLANAQFLGVCLNDVGNLGTLLMSKDGIAVCYFDGVPTSGAIAYLSPGTARALTTTVPAVAATNQKLRVGRVIGVVVGNLAKVALSPEILAVTADGSP